MESFSSVFIRLGSLEKISVQRVIFCSCSNSVRGLKVSPVLRENPLKSGMESLHKAEIRLYGAPRGLHLGLSCNITASEITTSNAPWIRTVLWNRWIWDRAVEVAERVARLMSQNKVFGLSPFFTTYTLFDLGQVT